MISEVTSPPPRRRVDDAAARHVGERRQGRHAARAVVVGVLRRRAQSARSADHDLYLRAVFLLAISSAIRCKGQSLWGDLNSLAGLIIAMVAPVLGAIADAAAGASPGCCFWSVSLGATAAALWYALPNEAGLSLFAISMLLVATFCLVRFHRCLSQRDAADAGARRQGRQAVGIGARARQSLRRDLAALHARLLRAAGRSRLAVRSREAVVRHRQGDVRARAHGRAALRPVVLHFRIADLFVHAGSAGHGAWTDQSRPARAHVAEADDPQPAQLSQRRRPFSSRA